MNLDDLKNKIGNETESEEEDYLKLKNEDNVEKNDESKNSTENKIAEHYNKIKRLSLKNRKYSEIIGIRNMHNFLKTILLREHRKSTVLDLGCGKGGDIGKYKKLNIKRYVGIDIADESLKCAIEQIENTQINHRMLNFDVFNKKLELNEKFGLVSLQFCFHYSFSSEDSFKITVENINNHIKVNGYVVMIFSDPETLIRRYRKYGNNFGNKYYRVNFADSIEEIDKGYKFGIEYKFKLIEAVDDCVEYLPSIDKIISEFMKYGFEVLENCSALEYYNRKAKLHLDVHSKMIKKRLTVEEIQVTELYRVMAFKKIK